MIEGFISYYGLWAFLIFSISLPGTVIMFIVEVCSLVGAKKRVRK